MAENIENKNTKNIGDKAKVRVKMQPASPIPPAPPLPPKLPTQQPIRPASPVRSESGRSSPVLANASASGDMMAELKARLEKRKNSGGQVEPNEVRVPSSQSVVQKPKGPLPAIPTQQTGRQATIPPAPPLPSVGHGSQSLKVNVPPAPPLPPKLPPQQPIRPASPVRSESGRSSPVLANTSASADMMAELKARLEKRKNSDVQVKPNEVRASNSQATEPQSKQSGVGKASMSSKQGQESASQTKKAPPVAPKPRAVQDNSMKSTPLSANIQDLLNRGAKNPSHNRGGGSGRG